MSSAVIRVAELNRLARSALEQKFPLLWVAGEISNLARAPSGHVYFSLKDESAQVRCAMFRSRAQLVPWRMENGQQVEVSALVTLYEARGEFQLNVEAVRRAGLGRLFEAFLALRDKLAGEGLFDTAAKRPLPRFPRCIGIVTSPNAAALHDILTALARRAPHVPVTLYPTLVQGEGAAAGIAAAIATAGRRAECDVLIVARGGGSIEDLWAFNDEGVARALRACPLPAVTGIGHETDTTIADLAADLRAATPTAAAELASAGWFDAAGELAGLAAELHAAMEVTLRQRWQAVDLAGHRLVHPAQRLAQIRQRITLAATRLAAAARRNAERAGRRLGDARLRLSRSRPALAPARQRLEALGAALQALNPQATLARGYAIVRNSDGEIVRDGAALAEGDKLAIRFAAGRGDAVVEKTYPD